MSKSATEAKIHDLSRQLEAEKTAHARTRRELQTDLERVWRLVPGGYVSLMGAYPPLRRLLHVLAEAADLQDPSRGAPIEDTMRTEYIATGPQASTSQTERGVFTHRRHREAVSQLKREVEWFVHRVSKLIPGTAWEYDPPDDFCPECGNPIWQPDTGRSKVYCGKTCRQSAWRRVET